MPFTPITNRELEELQAQREEIKRQRTTAIPAPRPEPITPQEIASLERDRTQVIKDRITEANKDRGYLGELGSAVAGGVVGAGQLGLRALRAAEGAVIPGTEQGPISRNLLTPGIEKLKKIESRSALLQPGPKGTRGLSGIVREGVTQATQSLVAGAPGALAGAAIGVLGGPASPVTVPLGAVVGFALSGGTQFGMAQFDDVIERADKAGIPRDVSQGAAVREGLYEGGFEFASDLLGGLLMGVAKPLSAPAKETLRQGVQSMFKEGFKQKAKQYAINTGKVMATEVPMEMATGGLQAEEERKIGLGDQRFWDAAKDAFGPTMVASMIFGGVGSVATNLQNRNTLKALQDPNIKPSERMRAVREVEETIKEVDPTAARAWGHNAQKAVLNGETIPINEDVIALAEQQEGQQTPPEAPGAAQPEKPTVVPQPEEAVPEEPIVRDEEDVETAFPDDLINQLAQEGIENDRQDQEGIPGEVGVGQEPGGTVPVNGAGAEEAGAGGAFQAPGEEEAEEVVPKIFTSPVFDTYDEAKRRQDKLGELGFDAVIDKVEGGYVLNWEGDQKRPPEGFTKKPEPDVSPSDQTAVVSSDLGAFPITRVPVSEIKARPDDLQFKEDVDTEGVQKPLEGDWNELAAGNLLVWEDKEGNKFVANGHHRLAKARQEGIELVNAQILKESDGYSIDDARRIAAEANILDGKGTIYDQAEYFRQTKDYTDDLARKRGFRSSKGYAIGRFAEAELYSGFRLRRISPEHAAAIAEAAPNNEGLQAAGLGFLQKHPKADPLEVAHFIHAASLHKGAATQKGLFGEDDSAFRNAELQAQVVTSIVKDIREQINAVRGAVKHPDKAAQLGVDVKDPVAVRRKLAELQEELSRWDKWWLDDDLTAQIDQAIATIEAGEKAQPNLPLEGEKAPQEAETPPTLAANPEAQAYVENLKKSKHEYAKAYHDWILGGRQGEAPTIPTELGLAQARDARDNLDKFYPGGEQLKAEEKPTETITPEQIAVAKDLLTGYLTANTKGILRSHIEQAERGELVPDWDTYIEKAKKEDDQNRPSKQKSPEEQPETPKVDIGEPDNIKIIPLSEYFLDVIRKGDTKRLNKIALQQMVADLLPSRIDPSRRGMSRIQMVEWPGFTHKPIEEAFEYAIVKRAREIIRQGKNTEDIYAQLKQLYETQPNLGTRTSVSVENQAYSTPVHLAFLAQEFAGVNKDSWVYEPTAGTGMLLTKAEPAQAWANEIDETRLEMLIDQGFLTSNHNGQEAVQNKQGHPRENQYDAVMANPPFNAIVPTKIDEYVISRLEHAIMIDALKGMADNGKAAFIIGGHNFKGDRMLDNQRTFLNWLYHNFNVTKNIDIPGDEYARQGASFPVRLIVLDGRKGEPAGVAPRKPEAYQKVDSIDELLPILKEVQNAREQGTVVAPGVEAVEQGEEGAGPSGPSADSDKDKRGELPSNAPGQGGRPSSAGEGPGAGVGGLSSEGVAAGEQEAGSAGGIHAAGPGLEGTGAQHAPVSEEGFKPQSAEGGIEPEGQLQGAGEQQGVSGGTGGLKPHGVSGTGAAGLESELEGLSEGDLDQLLAEAADEMEGEEYTPTTEDQLDETAPNQPKNPLPRKAPTFRRPIVDFLSWLDQRPPRRKPPERKPRGPRQPKSPKEALTSAGTNILEGAKDALAGLDSLFGGSTTLRMGITFDEETYAKAKPHFQAAWEHAKAAGYDIKTFFKMILERYGTRVAPYIKKFALEAQQQLKDQKEKQQKEQEKTETDYQITYTPKSKGPIVDETLIPRKMQEAVTEALNELEGRVGEIDDYVAGRLQYKNRDELYQAFSADQLDALALAVDNIERGQGMIVGDQTGVGKGRIAAGIIRYAHLNGYKPIFFTEKPNLFSDIYRDILDIGHDFNPYIMASDKDLATVLDQDGNPVYAIPSPLQRRQFMNRAETEGTGALGDFNIVLATYSQIQRANAQQRALMQLAHNNIVILDESHNASGDSTRGNFIRAMIENARGVLYLSATFAKRPDTMPVYYRTAMSEANMTIPEMVTAIEGGGTPLQEWVANALTSLGQYIRREKSFKGIDVRTIVSTNTRKQDERISDEKTAILRDIVDFDNLVGDWVNGFNDLIDEGDIISIWGIDIPPDQVIGDHTVSASVTTSNFASTVHNAVRQLLLAMKSQMAIDEAIKQLKEGKKPVIALSNTMGSFVEDQVANGFLREGEPFNLSFADVLKRHLRRTLIFTIRDPHGDTTRHEVPFDELPEDLQQRYRQIEAAIDQSIGWLPGSPIDYMKQKLMEAGYTVEELTARKYVADLEDLKNPILKQRLKKEVSSRNQIVKRFNDDETNVLIINAAGATGLSAHAAPQFKSHKPRVYLGLQGELNIDTEVQKMGRINRKGQVVLPSFYHLQLDIPAELRPAAVLMRKMKSLSANTSANADSVLAQKEIPDMFNRYGDHIARQWLMNNPEVHHELDIDEDRVELMHALTGKIAIQPVELQRQFFEDAEEEYDLLINDLKEQGLFDLEVNDIDFKAQVIEENLTDQGTNETNPFGSSTYRERLSVISPRKPMRKKDIVAAVEKTLKDTDSENYINKLVEEISEATTAYLEEKAAAALEADRVFNEDQIQAANQTIINTLANYTIGDTYDIYLEYMKLDMKGVLVDIRHQKGKGNPSALSRTSLVFAVNNSLRRLHIPISRIASNDRSTHATIYHDSYGITEDWDDLAPQDVRTERYMITGNLLQGFAHLPANSVMVRFTMEDGEVRQGALLPLNFTPPAGTKDRVRITARQAAGAFLDLNVLVYGRETRLWHTQGSIILEVPRARSTGGRYFLDEALRSLVQNRNFETHGQFMRAYVPRENVVRLIERIYELGDIYEVERSDYEQGGLDNLQEPVVEYGRDENKEQVRQQINDLSQTYGAGPSSSSKNNLGKNLPEVISSPGGRSYLVPVQYLSGSAAAAAIGAANLNTKAQEELFFAIADKDGKILGIHHHSKGDIGSGKADVKIIAGVVLRTKNAHRVYLVHNHPSGEPNLSNADRQVERALESLLSTQTGPVVESELLAVSPKGYSTTADPLDSASRPLPNVLAMGNRVPVFERIFKTHPGDNIPHLNGPDSVEYFGKKFLPNGGVILLNHQLATVGTLAIKPEKNLFRLRGEKKHIALLKEAEKRNASFLAIYAPDTNLLPRDIENIFDFARTAAFEVIDIIDKDKSHRLEIGDFAWTQKNNRPHPNSTFLSLRSRLEEARFPENTKELVRLSRMVDTWLANVLPKDVRKKVITDLKLVIRLEGRNFEESVKMWDELQNEDGEYAGATTFNKLGALIELSYRFDQEDVERTTYHEAYHVAKRWLLPDDDSAYLTSKFKNEEAEAEGFAEWATGRSRQEDTTLQRIWNYLKRIFTRMRQALTKRYNSPEEIFERIWGKGYRPTKGTAAEGTSAQRSQRLQLGQESDATPEQIPAHSPDITEAMKDAVLYQGQALFRRRGEEGAAAQPDKNPMSALPPHVRPKIEAARGIKRPGIVERMKEFETSAWHSMTRHYVHLDPKRFGKVTETLRRFEAIPESSKAKALRTLQENLQSLTPAEYDIFSMRLLLDDMIKDIESGLLDPADGLPFGFRSTEEVEQSLDSFKQMVAGNEKVSKAIEKRQRFMKDLRHKLVKAQFLNRGVLNDDRYWHHQVLEHIQKKYPGTGTSSKDVRVHKKGWQIGRIGSVKDYNTEYVESEFEVIAQGLSQLEAKKTIDEIDRAENVSRDLKAQAKGYNVDLMWKKLAAAGLIQTNEKTGEPIDPLLPFTSKMAMSFENLGRMASEGRLDSPPAEFDDVVKSLAETYEARKAAKEEWPDDPDTWQSITTDHPKLFQYLSWLINTERPGANWAATIFKAIKDRNKFIEEVNGKDHKTWRDLVPEGYTLWKPKPFTAWFMTNSLSDKVIEKIVGGDKQFDLNDVKQILARGMDVEWVIPNELAETMDHFRTYRDEGPIQRLAERTLNMWKQYILINPVRIIKYNLNNLSGDADICIAYDRKIVTKHGKQAAKDLWAWTYNKQMSSQLKAELDLAQRNAVIGSGMTVHDIPDVTRDMEIDRFVSALTGKKPELIKRFWGGSKRFTTWRENILRLAAYRFFKDQINSGKTNLYGASNPDIVNQTPIEEDRRAALLARELIGDYGNLSQAGQWLRRKMIPFYSWMEINAPRYVRLWRNLPLEGKGASKKIKVGSFAFAKAGTALTFRMATLYGMIMLWNMIFFPDEEEELGEAGRRQLHLILGRREDGSIISLRVQGALSDALSWFGSEDFPQDMKDLANREMSFYDWLKDAGKGFSNKILQGIRPDIKTAGETILGQSLYPDWTSPRPIRDKLEHVVRTFSLDIPYKYLAGKPIRGDTVEGRLLNDLMGLVTYASDPGEQAYYDTRSSVREFLEKKGDEQPSIIPTNRSNALYYYKQSLKYGDAKAAEKYLKKYQDLGGNLKGMRISIKLAHPLASLPMRYRHEFKGSLSPENQKTLNRAIKWYEQTYLKRKDAA